MANRPFLFKKDIWPISDSQELVVCCPRCKDPLAIERVPRGNVVRFISFLIPLRTYKCYRCFRKFHRFK